MLCVCVDLTFAQEMFIITSVIETDFNWKYLSPVIRIYYSDGVINDFKSGIKYFFKHNPELVIELA